MKKLVMLFSLVTFVASPAFAWEPTSKRCYKKTYEEPVFEVNYVKYKDPKEELRHAKNDIIEIVGFPAVFIAQKKLVREGRYVLHEVSCCPTCN